MAPYWSNFTMLLYLLMGMLAMACVAKAKNREQKFGYKKFGKQKAYLPWIAIWTLFAIFRYVDEGVGGTDAYGYMTYFQVCLDPGNSHKYSTHLELPYRLICMAVRSLTSDYHVLFFILYGIIAIAFVLFVNEFLDEYVNYIPLVVIFYPYLIGFNTIRTTLGAALILIGVVYISRNKVIPGVIIAFTSVLMQKASLFYAVFVIFYLLYKKGKLKIWHGVVWSVIATIMARIAQKILILTDFNDHLNGSYAYYAKRSLNSSFWDNWWKIAFGQLLLCAAVIILWKFLKDYEKKCSPRNLDRYKTIWIMCVYDFMMIPACYVLGIWRGYEYFYIPRLIMWGILLSIILKHVQPDNRRFIRIGAFFASAGWMVFRVWNTYEDAGLSPYIFKIVPTIFD